MGSDVNNRIAPAPPPPPGPSPMSSVDDPKISEIVQSSHDDRPSLAGFDPSSLIGRHFLITEENGERLAGNIVDYVGNFQYELEGERTYLNKELTVIIFSYYTDLSFVLTSLQALPTIYLLRDNFPFQIILALGD